MHFQVVEITLDVALASIRFLPIITLQCKQVSRHFLTHLRYQINVLYDISVRYDYERVVQINKRAVWNKHAEKA